LLKRHEIVRHQSLITDRAWTDTSNSIDLAILGRYAIPCLARRSNRAMTIEQIAPVDLRLARTSTIRRPELVATVDAIDGRLEFGWWFWYRNLLGSITVDDAACTFANR
jgi:hypothetical protein